MYNVEVSTPYGALKARFRSPGRQGGLVVIFLGGLLSDQLATQDSRAHVLDTLCDNRGIGSIRFNYTAHGWSTSTRSEGEFRDVSVTRMVRDAIQVVEYFSPHKIAFAASSIGAGLLPFLLEHLEGKHTVDGCFTVSAVSPDKLKDFVTSLLSPIDRDRLANGEDVDLCSSTLPVTIQVNRSQMEDLSAYRELPEHCNFAISRRPSLLRGSRDGLSTPLYNNALARTLGGSEGDVVVLESDHEIPFEPMLRSFSPWLNASSLAEAIAK